VRHSIIDYLPKVQNMNNKYFKEEQKCGQRSQKKKKTSSMCQAVDIICTLTSKSCLLFFQTVEPHDPANI